MYICVYILAILSVFEITDSCSCIPPNQEIIKNVCIGPSGTPLCNCTEKCQVNIKII